MTCCNKAGRSAPALPKLTLSPYSTMRTDWLASAAALPGKTLHTAIAIWSLIGRGAKATVVVGPAVLRRFDVSRDAGYDALTRLEAARLITVKRGKGCLPSVTLLDKDGREMVLRAEPSIEMPRLPPMDFGGYRELLARS